MFNRLIFGRYEKKIITSPIKTGVFLLVSLMLSGCLSASVKLPDTHRRNIQSIRVVAVEAPPLQIIPDQLETRMPVYEHYDNMVLPISTPTKIYRQPGGLLVAGRVGEGDKVEIVDSAISDQDWTPSAMLLQEAISQLNGLKFQIKPESRTQHLPGVSYHDADLTQWHDAAETWYENNQETLSEDAADADAILQLAVGQYKLFAGQVSLQVLIKLVDAKTGKVLARVGEKSTAYEAPIPALLDNDSNKFKSAMRQRAKQLLAQGFHDIGLTSN